MLCGTGDRRRCRPPRPGSAEPGTAAARAARGVSAAPPPPITAARGRGRRRRAPNRLPGGVGGSGGSPAHHVDRGGKLPVRQARRPRPPRAGGGAGTAQPLGGAAGRGVCVGVVLSPCPPVPSAAPPSPAMATAPGSALCGQSQPLLSLSAASPQPSPCCAPEGEATFHWVPPSPRCLGLVPTPSPAPRGTAWGQQGTRGCAGGRWGGGTECEGGGGQGSRP